MLSTGGDEVGHLFRVEILVVTNGPKEVDASPRESEDGVFAALPSARLRL